VRQRRSQLIDIRVGMKDDGKQSEQPKRILAMMTSALTFVSSFCLCGACVSLLLTHSHPWTSYISFHHSPTYSRSSLVSHSWTSAVKRVYDGRSVAKMMKLHDIFVTTEEVSNYYRHDS